MASGVTDSSLKFHLQNAKAGLGSSAIVSVPYTISQGIGLGTVVSMLGVGRVIYFFNHFAKARLQRLAGLAPQETVSAAK